ncbi:kinase phosphorylation protein-domain-containing protein [Xylariomycetidae sp. FL2044]|nr:kinase phosphorylation protein-domain-containing protein [Xylariomycetidae sp. FL2044]
MDLVSSIRKSGSRGGVNFSWDDVASSNHRENYLGHSLKAPVGRWAKGRDLTWYANAEGAAASTEETEEERAARQRKEEFKKIKEAEEDALARALGLPVAPRNTTGANAVEVSEGRGVAQTDVPTLQKAEAARDNNRSSSKRHNDPEQRHRRRHRSRSRSRDRHRDRSPRRRDESYKHRSRGYPDVRDGRREYRRRRSYSRERDEHRYRAGHRRERSRSRSPERAERRREDHDDYRPRPRDQRRQSRSPRARRHSPSLDDR